MKQKIYIMTIIHYSTFKKHYKNTVFFRVITVSCQQVPNMTRGQDWCAPLPWRQQRIGHSLWSLLSPWALGVTIIGFVPFTNFSIIHWIYSPPWMQSLQIKNLVQDSPSPKKCHVILVLTRRSHPGARGGGDPSCASIIIFFFTFLNLLVFFLFFQKVQKKKKSPSPSKPTCHPVFFAWKMTFPFEMVPFLGDIRSFSGGSNWFPRCELPVYHRSG